MFSSTTIASSITIPTASVSASRVMLFSVKSITFIRVKVATMEVGMAREAMSTERTLRMKRNTTSEASTLPKNRCSSRESMEALMKTDWSRMMPEGTPGGSVFSIWASFPLMVSMILTVLVPDCRRTSRVTACLPSSMFQVRGSAKLSSTRPRSLTRMGVPPTLRTMMSPNWPTASSRPSVRTPSSDSPAADGASGDLDVFVLDGALDVDDGQAVGGQLVRVGEDADLALAGPREADLAHAVHRLQDALDPLVRDLGRLAQAPVAGHDHGQHGIGVRVGLLDDGGQDVRRQVAQGARHLLAHVLGRAFDVALEHELAVDAGACPACTCDVTSSMPLMVESASSSGNTTWVVISSGVDPGSLMLMLTVAGSARGKRSTPRSRNEKMPSTPRKAISMTANTARLTHSSARVDWGAHAEPRAATRLRTATVRGVVAAAGPRRSRRHRISGPGRNGRRRPAAPRPRRARRQDPSFRPDDDLDLGALARAELDLGLVERALLDGVDLVDAVQVAQRVLGHDQGLVHVAGDDAGPREEARLEQPLVGCRAGPPRRTSASADRRTDSCARPCPRRRGRDRPRPAPSPAGRPRPSPPSSRAPSGARAAGSCPR